MAINPFKKLKTKTNEQLIADIDERLKVNKGGFSAEGYDTDSTFTPQRVSDRSVANPYEGMGAFERVPQKELKGADYSNIQTTEPTEEIPQQQEDYGINASQFNQMLLQASNPFSQMDENQKYEYYRETGIPYAVGTTDDGGILLSTNEILYEDGTKRINDSNTPLEQATAKDYRIQDTFGANITDAKAFFAYTLGNYNQTQAYGNYNPGLGYANNTHSGWDVVSYNDYSFPVDVKVIDNNVWDGTSKTGKQAYGNSILVELPTGERLRYSHLADAPSFNPGDTIPAFTFFGRMGNSGNSTGFHTDIEYYNRDGQLDNPLNFGGLQGDPQWKESVAKNVNTYYQTQQTNTQADQTQEPQGQVLGEKVQQEQPQQPSAFQQVQFPNTKIERMPDNMTPYDDRNIIQKAGEVLGTGVQNLNATGQYGTGWAYNLKGEPDKARAQQAGTLSRIGTKLGAPELKTDELSQEQKTNPLAQLAGNVTDVAGRKIGLPEYGVSELIAGGKTTTTGQPDDNNGIFDKIKQGTGNAITFVNDFLSNIKSADVPQPGDFLTKKVYASELKSPELGQMNQEFGIQIGDSPNSSMTSQPSMRMGETYQSRFSEGQADNRDPFFKPGGMGERYSQYLKPNADQVAGGALDTSVFGNNFFERRTAQPDIQSVFGGTHLAGQANQKFETYRTNENEKAINQIKSMYGGGEWDQADVSRIIAELRAGKGFIEPSQVRQPAKAYKPTIEDYLRQGKTIAQYYAETGQQSVLDKFGSPEAAMKAYTGAREASNRAFSGQNVDVSNVNLTPQQYQQSYQQVTQGNKPSDPNALYRADQQYEQSTQNFGNVYNGMKVDLGQQASPYDLFKKKDWNQYINPNGYLKL